MNIDDNGNSYAEMRTVTFSNNESRVPSSHDLVGDGYAQLPVLMSDSDGKEFMVHFADDRDMENMDEDIELGVGADGLKGGFQQEDGGEDAREENRLGHPIPDQERFLPIANVARVMKRMIPSSGKIAKDAKECVQECVSEFISFITSEANDKCLSEKRKTISADDLLEAITNMGFDNYVAPLQLFLERYRAAHKLSTAFPNAAGGPRSFSVGSEGSSNAMDGGAKMNKFLMAGSPGVSGNREYSTRSLVEMTPTTSATSTGHSYQSTSSSNGAPVVLAGGVGGMPVTALHQQPMQIYIDPASKQHYMAIETEQGMQLYPIQIQTDGPVAYTVAPEVATAMTSNNSSDNQTFIMMATGDVEENHMSPISREQLGRAIPVERTIKMSVTIDIKQRTSRRTQRMSQLLLNRVRGTCKRDPPINVSQVQEKGTQANPERITMVAGLREFFSTNRHIIKKIVRFMYKENKGKEERKKWSDYHCKPTKD
ncbi:hypothetical protein ANCCEY_10606 [Ancylostoma ceylanicum]|uniref:Nuclear transcription factor Y subunit beta n=1 Tax=Ancylostoma ceylanicum TaxID=53326 RepID=A0A0D6LEE3_9BILA|nr:hypothetical protein ANCCEY_10606 [Ancylostoma ceylanicum]